jgi:hypothetical protein
MFENLAQQAELARLSAEGSPMRGTWEVRVVLPSGREVQLWIRTAQAPAGFSLAFREANPRPESIDPWSLKWDGSSLHFWASRDSAGLPPPGVPARAEPYWPIEVSAKDSMVGEFRVRSALLEIGEATWPADIDAEVSELFERYAALKLEESRAAGWKYQFQLGRISEAPDGVVTFEQILELGPRVVIRARRVSGETIAGNGYPIR